MSLSGDSSGCQLLRFPWPGAGAAAVKADDVMDQLYFIVSWRLRETLQWRVVLAHLQLSNFDPADEQGRPDSTKLCQGKALLYSER